MKISRTVFKFTKRKRFSDEQTDRQMNEQSDDHGKIKMAPDPDWRDKISEMSYLYVNGA